MKPISKEDFKNIKTIGQLKQLLSRLLKEINTKSTKKTLVKAIVSEIPGLGTAKNVSDIMKKLARNRPDSERPDNPLGILDIDDYLEKIISPEVMENFLNYLVMSINDNDNTPVDEWNINEKLGEWLKEIYRGRSVKGFKENVDINKSILKEYIRAYLK